MGKGAYMLVFLQLFTKINLPINLGVPPFNVTAFEVWHLRIQQLYNHEQEWVYF
jgi:hypothetical protein